MEIVVLSLALVALVGALVTCWAFRRDALALREANVALLAALHNLDRTLSQIERNTGRVSPRRQPREAAPSRGVRSTPLEFLPDGSLAGGRDRAEYSVNGARSVLRRRRNRS